MEQAVSDAEEAEEVCPRVAELRTPSCAQRFAKSSRSDRLTSSKPTRRITARCCSGSSPSARSRSDKPSVSGRAGGARGSDYRKGLARLSCKIARRHPQLLTRTMAAHHGPSLQEWCPRPDQVPRLRHGSAPSRSGQLRRGSCSFRSAWKSDTRPPVCRLRCRSMRKTLTSPCNLVMYVRRRFGKKLRLECGQTVKTCRKGALSLAAKDPATLLVF